MPLNRVLESLRQSVPAILPSMLMCDFGNLAQEVQRLESAQVAGLHLDIMDGQFVPNLTYGMPIVSAIRKLTELPLDVHLMIADPRRYLRDFRSAGADVVTFHVEAVADPRPVLDDIHGLGMSGGVAINPDTKLESVERCIGQCDLVLAMSVPAGFGGQAFRQESPDRLRQLRQLAGPDVLLEVDGGISHETIRACSESGAQLFVVGSALFRNAPYGDYVERLRQAAA